MSGEPVRVESTDEKPRVLDWVDVAFFSGVILVLGLAFGNSLHGWIAAVCFGLAAICNNIAIANYKRNRDAPSG